MKVDIIGASNIAISMYKDFYGEYKVTMEINLETVLQEKMEGELNSFVAFTIAKNGDVEKSYTDFCDGIVSGDILILQGEGNDAGMNIEIGNVNSKDINTYYGALNYISSYIKKKYKIIVFTTGFNPNGESEYDLYNKAIKDVAEENDFILIDFYKNDLFRGKEMLPDNEHMSEKALKKYAEFLLEKII